MTFYFLTFLKGMAISFSLIIPVGMQNAFMLRQGIMQNHVFAIALTCALSDAFLIMLGINGIEKLWATNDYLLKIANYGGIIFLYAYGIKSFISAIKAHNLVVYSEILPSSLKRSVLTALAVSLLNPHSFLDTCIFMSSIASNFSSELLPSLTIGAILASFIWFFVLGYGAKYLRKTFESPKSWKILDFLIGCVMFALASSLLYSIL